MNTRTIQLIFISIILLLAQVLVLNHIHLFGVAMPLLYVYIMLVFPRKYARWKILIWGFAMGLSIDIFLNTPGLAASSMTFIGLVQPNILDMFIQKENAEDIEPTMKSLGTMKYIYYSAILVLIYCIIFFSLEAFNFFNWVLWLECLSGSWALTLLLILVIESVRTK